MNGITFEWNRQKEAANRRKHGIDFGEASSVFADTLSITIPDPDHSVDEERFLIVGMSSNRKLLVVVHTIRKDRIRIISVCLATKHEKRNYEEDSR
jgi:uncharacterized DUF497 family protein